MATLQALVDQTKADYLDAGQREVVSRLNGAIGTTTVTTFTLSVTAPVAYSVLTIDYEDILVLTVSGLNVTDCLRGVNGTTKATHADLATVYHNQKFTEAKIVRQINNEMRALTSDANGLYRVRTINVATVSGQLGYDLATVTGDFLRPLGVWLRAMTGATSDDYTRQVVRITRDLPAADFPSGMGMFFRRALPASRTFQFVYAAKYGEVTTADMATDMAAATIGVPIEHQDILPIGAAIRLAGPREIKRNFTEAQPESRRSADVPPGAVARSPDSLRLLRANRIAEERARLQAKYPFYLNIAS